MTMSALLLGIPACDAYGSDHAKEAMSPKLITYKTVHTTKGDFDLKLHVFYPKHAGNAARPCIVFFHGGGWNSGAPTHYYRSARELSLLGLVAISVEYRIKNRHDGSALDSVRDVKSAMRWIRSHADKLKVDPDKIAALGSSAGGHLAAACATLSSFDEEGEDTTVSCVPNALLLVSPVLDNGPGGYGQYKKEVRENWKAFSPYHNVRKGIPPALVTVGTDEAKYLRVEVAKDLKRKMEEVGSRCELLIIEGLQHGKRIPEHQKMIDKAKMNFLKSMGYIGNGE